MNTDGEILFVKLTFHSTDKNTPIHNSLLIRVHPRSFDEIFKSSQFVHVRCATIVVHQTY
jgi:hypothetical protein